MYIFEFRDEIKITKDGEPAIELICKRKGDPLVSGDTIKRMVWLSPFQKFNFQITKELDGCGCIINSLQTNLNHAIDFSTNFTARDKLLGYGPKSDLEFAAKTHLAGLISITLIDYANLLIPNGSSYRLPPIKYVSDDFTAEQMNVLALRHFIEKVYSYLQN